MKQGNILIIFVKNLIYGKVKTRLAATIGDSEAVEVYKNLIAHTSSFTEKLPIVKIVFYSDYIEENDMWSETVLKAKQKGSTLGERMSNAFTEVFRMGYSKAVMIGSDCPGLTEEIINEAYKQLDKKDIVIGPAYDGGYYSLAMKVNHQQLFENIQWSTNTVLDATIAICAHLNLSYHLLPVLHDIDEEKDLEHFNQVANE